MSQSPRFFHFSYLGPYIDETPRIHEIRDGDAFAELSAALYSQGYEYHGLIMNYPQPEPEFNLSELKPADLLVITTRPPLDDDEEFDRKIIKKSDTELEEKILKTLRNYFVCCTRRWVKIKEEFADFLTHPDRSETEFHIFQDKVHGGHKSRYKRYRNMYAKKRAEEHGWHYAEEQNLTAAYMILTRIKDGPMLLNAFGMGGQTTLIWCYLLRTKYAYLLKSPRFVIAEIETDPRPPRPATLSFALKWKVTLLLNHPLS